MSKAISWASIEMNLAVIVTNNGQRVVPDAICWPEHQCFCDAEYASLFGFEGSTEPVCACSWTGFLITVAICPVFWQSKLQTETASSTMEAETVELGSSCKELFLTIAMVLWCYGKGDRNCSWFGARQCGQNAHQNSWRQLLRIGIDEDNSTTVYTQSKHYALKTHQCHEKVIEHGIEVLKIETSEQLGDIFTKYIPKHSLFICPTNYWDGNAHHFNLLNLTSLCLLEFKRECCMQEWWHPQSLWVIKKSKLHLQIYGCCNNF